ncbi:MAG: hypothetical protein DDT20_01125 [Firmicutes bacterium]|nr:hypothetical protein [Bacillota bacterium]
MDHTPKRKVMIMLVGGRQVPNALGILAYKPDVVGFIASRDTPQDLQKIKEFTKTIPNLDVLKPVEVDAFSMSAVADACEEMITQQANAETVLNLTTGTTIMSLGGYEAAKRQRVTSVYVATAIGKIITVTGSSIPGLDLGITVNEYLTIYGRTSRETFLFSKLSINQKAALEVARFLVNTDARECLSLMRRWNRGTDKRTIHGKLNSPLNSETINAFMRLKQLGLIQGLSIQSQQVSYLIPCEPNWKYLDGTWLEAYCWETAQSLKDSSGRPVFDEVRFSLEIVSQAAVSEIDLFCLHQGQPLIASCKTEDLSFKTQYLEELQSRADMLGGRFCGKLFITNMPAPSPNAQKRRDFDRFLEQAKAREIVVVTGDHLADLPKVLLTEATRPTYPRL